MLSDKRVLLICPEFYDYRQKVESALVSAGYRVVSIKERPRRWLYSSLKRLVPKALTNLFYDYYFCKHLSVLDKDYDLILCIRGEVVSEKFLKKLRQRNPSARFVLYQWDSIKVTNFKRLLPYFDDVKSFDFKDCAELGLTYVPLFFSEDYLVEEKCDEPEFDLVYVGSFNLDRYRILLEILESAKKNGLKVYSHLYLSKLDYYKLRLLSGSAPHKSHVKFNTIDRDEVINLIKSSRAVLDIENANQSGFTMRTFEALAIGRLLLTTNNYITELAELKGNWALIDRGDIQLPNGIKDYSVSRPDAINNYSIDSWLASVLQ